MTTTDFDLKSVRPAIKGRSDKYSWRLYVLLNLKPWVKFYLGENNLLGKGKEVYVGLVDPSSPEWFHGAPLMRILCGESQFFAYGHAFTSRLEPVPDFLEKYQAVGRCAWDPGHDGWMMDDESRFRFSADGNIRTCQWCGETQVKTVEEVVHKVERWVNPAWEGLEVSAAERTDFIINDLRQRAMSDPEVQSLMSKFGSGEIDKVEFNKAMGQRFRVHAQKHLEAFEEQCWDRVSTPPWLPSLLSALGWKGGTIHQALAEVQRLAEADKSRSVVHIVELRSQFEAMPWDSEGAIAARKHEALWRMAKSIPADFVKEPGALGGTYYTLTAKFLPVKAPEAKGCQP